MKHNKRDVEWNLFILFAGILLVWLFIALPFLDNLSKTNGVVMSYGLYLVGLGVIGYFFGDAFHKGIESLFLFIATTLGIDLMSPPTIIQFNQLPSAEILSIWGSDTFVYQIWGILGLSHQITWILTYCITPLIGFFVLLYFLSGKKLRNALQIKLNGG